MKKKEEKLTLAKIAQHFLLAHQVAGVLFPPQPPKVEPPPPPDPMEGFAGCDELLQYKMREGSFYLGRVHPDHGANFQAGIADDRHLFLMAGSRSGKGVSFLVLNAVLWPGALFMIDPKGEAASITAMHRATRGEAIGRGHVPDFQRRACRRARPSL